MPIPVTGLRSIRSPPEELTLAEALKPLGYASGHFGKWHLGDFQGGKKSSPSDNGFDEWFSTVRKTPTYDPEGYWSNGEPVTDVLEGDDSTHIVSRALDFIRRKVEERTPFFVALWFHTPHLPIISKGNHRTIYGGHAGESPNYWGAISAMDEQLGRLRRELRRMDVGDDTMFWFSSDNGPEGAEQVSRSARVHGWSPRPKTQSLRRRNSRPRSARMAFAHPRRPSNHHSRGQLGYLPNDSGCFGPEP